MSADDLPVMPWRVEEYEHVAGRTRWDVVDARGWPIVQNTTRALAHALARPDVAALLRGEAVAVPREPTEEMVAAAAKATFCSDGWSSFFDLHDAEYLAHDGYRAMLAASPFAKEGKE